MSGNGKQVVTEKVADIGQVPPDRGTLFPDEVLWVAIVRGEKPVKTSSGDEVSGWHLATLVTRSEKDGARIVAGSISEAMDRYEVQHAFSDYADRNIVPDPDEP